MAKLNTKAHLSPLKADLQDNQVDDEEVEAGSDDEQTANILRLSLNSSKKQASNEAPTTSMSPKMLGFLTPRTVEKMSSPTHGPADSNEGQHDADLEGEEEDDAEESTAPSPMKRKRDIYNFDQAHPEKAGPGDVVEQPSRKNHKTTKKAKPPLVSHKLSKGSVATQRQTRASKKVAPQELESRMNRSVSSPARRSGAVTRPPKKRRRGRPPKQRAVEPHFSGDRPEIQGTRQHEEGGFNEVEEEEEEEEEAFQDSAAAAYEISTILLDPSPVKPLLSEKGRSKSSGRLPKSAEAPLLNGSRSQKSHSAQRARRQPSNSPETGESNGISFSENDAAEEEDEAEDDDLRPNALEDEEEQEDELLEIIGDLISVDEVEKMLETARKVGHIQGRKTKEWLLKRAEAVPFTVPGKRMRRRIDKLIEACNNLQVARTSGDQAAQGVAQSQVSEFIEKVKEESQAIFSERLGNPALGIPFADTQVTKSMLLDIYFILVPILVEALLAFVKANQDEELSEVDTLQQVFDLVDLLQNLAEGAMRQPPKSQPKAPPSNPYRISLPAKHILPTLRTLHKSLGTQISDREHAERLAAWNNDAPKRLQRQRALERRKDEELCRQRAERSYAQNAVVKELLRDPRFNNSVQLELKRAAEAREKTIEMQAARLSQPGPYRNSQRANVEEPEEDDDGVEDDPFHDRPERLMGVFPNDSKNTFRLPNPLTEEERVIFIDIMRFKPKATRYEVASKQLGRSPEEIFELATDLQVAMDAAHERGEWDQPEDSWSYEIISENTRSGN